MSDYVDLNVDGAPEAPTGLAVLLPGYLPLFAMPLLLFAGRALAEEGWHVRLVDWDPPEDRDPDWVVGELQMAIGDHDGRVMVVGKSLATTAAPYVTERGYDAVWLTPLLQRPAVAEAISRHPGRQLLVGGTADPSWKPEIAAGSGADVLEVPGADRDDRAGRRSTHRPGARRRHPPHRRLACLHPLDPASRRAEVCRIPRSTGESVTCRPKLRLTTACSAGPVARCRIAAGATCPQKRPAWPFSTGHTPSPSRRTRSGQAVRVRSEEPRELADLAVITRSDALKEGYDDRGIRRALASGEWHPIRQGAYIPTAVWAALDERDRHRATALAVSRRAECEHAWSHFTAYAHLVESIWELPLDDVHLTRFDGRSGRRCAGVVQHRGRLRVDDLTVRDGQLITDGTRTGLDVASLVDVEHGVVAVGTLLHAGETTLPSLHHRMDAMGQWPHTLRLKRVLQLADPRPESVPEHRLVYWFWRQGVPPPIPQHEVVVDGRIYRLDFAWPERKVWLEFDGKVKLDRCLRPGETAADAVWREKRREDLIREATGWICIRVTWADLADPRRLERRIRRALRLAAG